MERGGRIWIECLGGEEFGRDYKFVDVDVYEPFAALGVFYRAVSEG